MGLSNGSSSARFCSRNSSVVADNSASSSALGGGCGGNVSVIGWVVFLPGKVISLFALRKVSRECVVSPLTYVAELSVRTLTAEDRFLFLSPPPALLLPVVTVRRDAKRAAVPPTRENFRKMLWA